jgi:hypothetical protein
MASDPSNLRSSAAELARNLAWVPGRRDSNVLRDRCRKLSPGFTQWLRKLRTNSEKGVSDEVRLLQESAFLLAAEMEEVCSSFSQATQVPHVRTPDGAVIPRIAAIADDLLVTTAYRFSETAFSAYTQAFQEVVVLQMAELWVLIPVLKLVLLEQVFERGRHLQEDPNGAYGVQNLIRSVQEIRQTAWKAVIEPLILFDQILRQDPAGAYSRMDYESRDLYRRKLVEIAARSDFSEIEVASELLTLAREAQNRRDDDLRLRLRDSHVGFYLLAEGRAALGERVGFHPRLGQRLRALMLRHPDEFYLPGIAALTFAIVLGAVLWLTAPDTSLELILLAILAVLLPSSQSAVQIVNYVATLLFPAQILPKLDFSQAIPDDCVSLVSVPAMLLNEKQVHKLVDDLEVRFLGNQDPNLHFALLTDLPDSPSEPREDGALVEMCSELVRKLAEKYAEKGMGSFFLFHRNLVYNPRERLWMGWERKRGKLMDLNNLLCGQYDSFPVKVGDLSLLPSIRFVITLDADTELPRGSAHRLVGTLAHPLNQAVIDPEKGVVVAGYGILQPRVGISVQSTARSKLASIYSGETGLDIYTHATSDVYQDLYGEGIFVGKGIYEVKTLERVLARRFPRNALLSHDLIEGAYARAGLVSDIEVIEDYPSHYNAYNRRKHRWLRGDWQITEWLLPQVPEESGKRVPNPLSVASRWRILDNLRRSLVEPATFLLFVLGWIALPGRPRAWTLAAIAIPFLPALCQLAVDLTRGAIRWKGEALVDGLGSFVNVAITNFLTLTFLAHQALLALDAVARTLVRRFITRQRLLQWETAAEAELVGNRRTTLDIYLSWTPALALALFALVWFVHRAAVSAAVPVLLLWAVSKPIAMWLNRPTRAPRRQPSQRDEWLLRLSALRTWRYFADFSTEEHHWLIPDNVQEDELKVAPRISPTNLGFLLNARQVAWEFGYLTAPEFAQQTLRTLATVSQLQKYRGHLLNWYDTQTLQPLAPLFVSSVDSGNLMASLWTLQQGCRNLLDRPLLQSELRRGFLDHVYVLASLGALPRRKFSEVEKALKQPEWLRYLLDIPDDTLKELRQSASHSKHGAHARWFQEQAEQRIREVNRTVQTHTPWLLPEYAALKDVIHPKGRSNDLLALQRIPAFIDNLSIRLRLAIDSGDHDSADNLDSAQHDSAKHDSAKHAESVALCRELLSLLPDARSHVLNLIDDLKKIAEQSSALADDMEFGFLLNPSRQLLSVGFDVPKEEVHAACYDLLASEARIAFFTAIAKDDIPQESWFQLGRPQIVVQGISGLLSWTGTMFEYLMPALWMRTYPTTLLERATVAAVRAQRAYANHKRIPWGISESACFRTDSSGNYQYHAFGIPQLAIHKPDQDGPVISPYSTFLALDIDPTAALRNLRLLRRKRALGTFGFYESLDFNPVSARSRSGRFELVRCWMAHHQGMSLLAIGNFLHDAVVQGWFHSHPQVQATELLLQEKLAGHPRPRGPRAQVA